MTRLFLSLPLFALALLPAAADDAPNADKGKPLFNGTDLTGWKGEGYVVEDGAIVCTPQGKNLMTERTFANYAFDFEFKLPPAGNNGLAIRYPGSGDSAYVGMTELQVLDDGDPKYADLDPRQAHGSAYGMVAARRGHLKPVGQWNEQEVTVTGSTIKVVLNGATILDADLSTVTSFMADSPHPGKDRTEGHFGFAGHNDPVAFRNIRIRELP